MSKVLSAAIALFSLILVFVSFMDIFIVQAEDKYLDQVDIFLANRISVEGAFTPEVESDLIAFLNELGLSYDRFDFSGTPSSPVPWGQTIDVKYTYIDNQEQKGLAYLSIEEVKIKPRDIKVVSLGR